MKTVAKLIHELSTMPQEGIPSSDSQGLQIQFEGKTHRVHLPFKHSEERLYGCEGSHVLRSLTEYELNDPWMSVSAECDLCGDHFGWRCKVSPDSICHYRCECENGVLYTPNGREMPVPEDWKKACSESCIFCGMPDERK